MPMAAKIRIILAGLVIAGTSPAMATQLSPWLGSADQTPFQLDPTTMVAVTFAADPLQTGSMSKAPCHTEGCVPAPKTASDGAVVDGAPQN
jgi:hypothetical protein